MSAPDDPPAAPDYTGIRKRLVSYFRYRGCADPQDLAQEVLRRGLSRLSEGIDLQTPIEHFLCGIARNVHYESRRADASARRQVPLEERMPEPDPELSRFENRQLLKQLFSLLSADEQRLLREYYLGDRKRLQRDLDVSPAALRLRVFRTREKLEALLEKQLGSLK